MTCGRADRSFHYTGGARAPPGPHLTCGGLETSVSPRNRARQATPPCQPSRRDAGRGVAVVIRERLRSQVGEARRQRLMRGRAASLISVQSCVRTATATPQLTCGAREALTSRCASTSAILYSGRHRSTASQLGTRRRTCAARIVEIEVRAVASRAAHSKSAVTPCLTVLIFFGNKNK